MPLILRKNIIRTLVVVAALGWILAANFMVRVVPGALAGTSAISSTVDTFAYARFDTLRDGTWQRLTPYVTGPAADAVTALAAVKAQGMPEAAIDTGSLHSTVLMASDGRALVVTDYSARRTISEGSKPIRELAVLLFSDGIWHISALYSVIPNSSAPLVPPTDTLETVMPSL